MSAERILIIEDNVRNLKLVRDVLQFHGYSILEAETGEAGIALAREQQPALILMDIQLPGMDGRAALKVLKADASTQHLPVVALTSFAMKGDRESLLAEGFDDYMAKPIDIKELPKVVERSLRKQS